MTPDSVDAVPALRTVGNILALTTIAAAVACSDDNAAPQAPLGSPTIPVPGPMTGTPPETLGTVEFVALDAAQHVVYEADAEVSAKDDVAAGETVRFDDVGAGRLSVLTERDDGDTLQRQVVRFQDVRPGEILRSPLSYDASDSGDPTPIDVRIPSPADFPGGSLVALTTGCTRIGPFVQNADVVSVDLDLRCGEDQTILAVLYDASETPIAFSQVDDVTLESGPLDLPPWTAGRELILNLQDVTPADRQLSWTLTVETGDQSLEFARRQRQLSGDFRWRITVPTGAVRIDYDIQVHRQEGEWRQRTDKISGTDDLNLSLKTDFPRSVSQPKAVLGADGQLVVSYEMEDAGLQADLVLCLVQEGPLRWATLADPKTSEIVIEALPEAYDEYNFSSLSAPQVYLSFVRMGDGIGLQEARRLLLENINGPRPSIPLSLAIANDTVH